MLVTLSSPPGAQLRGVVSSIEPGKSLTLRNVTCPANGKYLPEFTIKAAEILELVEAAAENAPAPPPPPPAAKPNTFEDPAILSMGKRPEPVSKTPIPELPQWNSNAMERGASVRTTTARDTQILRTFSPPDVPIEALRTVDLNGGRNGVQNVVVEELDAKPQVSPELPVVKPIGRRTRRRKGQGRKNEEILPDPDVIPARETIRSKGWRNTPLLEPNPSFQPFSTLRRKKNRGRIDENGWATEDATDVQDMGDFDFAGSLAKFDKQTVFTQIQAEDSIAAEDRLVSHNRLPKATPGTSGGKNLHYTENVLDVPNDPVKVTRETWRSDSEADERVSQMDTGSGRHSRRAESKMSMNRRPVSQKGSSTSGQPARSHSFPAPQKPAFSLIPSGRRCEPISALQMLNLENIADNDLGLSEDMMAENAGRGVAEVALSVLIPGNRGLAMNSIAPTIVVLSGNNKSGLRAVSAGRHLRNHGINVIICMLGLEREAELLAGLRRQLKVFRSFGGKIVTKTELFDYIKSLSVPIELIVDGLLGLTMSFEELRTGDQATAFELIEWANRSKASVLAIDIPTGIDPTTGKVSIIDGRQLYIHTKYVVAMGAPKKGLLEAMLLGEGVMSSDDPNKGDGWHLFVADIGLGNAVWKKAGTRVRRGVEFEGSWVLGMTFQADVLLPNYPLSSSPLTPIYIIDWELSTFGHVAFDLGQMFADLYELVHFKDIAAGTWIIEGFMDGYGEMEEETAFRVAIHAGMHLIRTGRASNG
ncbi:hypothetical protein B7494_g1036 [Chlorociboria aeruginascens]|nr:hypothetical protein B7494_g1036 [Chlorociboria aeruginascens]